MCETPVPEPLLNRAPPYRSRAKWEYAYPNTVIIRPITSTSFSKHSRTSAAIATSSWAWNHNIKREKRGSPLHGIDVQSQRCDLFLTFHIASPLQYFGKEDVEALLNGQKDEARHHGAQVVDDVVDALVSKAKDVQEGHDVALALSQDLLQEGLLKETPCEPGHGPVYQWLQTQQTVRMFECTVWLCLNVIQTASCSRSTTSPIALRGSRSLICCRGKVFFAASLEPRKRMK